MAIFELFLYSNLGVWRSYSYHILCMINHAECFVPQRKNNLKILDKIVLSDNLSIKGEYIAHYVNISNTIDNYICFYKFQQLINDQLITYMANMGEHKVFSINYHNLYNLILKNTIFSNN